MVSPNPDCPYPNAVFATGSTWHLCVRTFVKRQRCAAHGFLVRGAQMACRLGMVGVPASLVVHCSDTDRRGSVRTPMFSRGSGPFAHADTPRGTRALLANAANPRSQDSPLLTGTTTRAPATKQDNPYLTAFPPSDSRFSRRTGKSLLEAGRCTPHLSEDRIKGLPAMPNLDSAGPCAVCCARVKPKHSRGVITQYVCRPVTVEVTGTHHYWK